MTGIEVLLLLAILVILVMLIGLAVAETGLNRISPVKARAMIEDDRGRSAEALADLVERPERFINPLLVTVTVLQTAQAFLTTVLAGRLFGAWGVAGAFVVNVVVFFVLAESMPKTWAVLHTERAALSTARPVAALISFPPLRLVSKGLIGLTNLLLPGRGLKQGPFVSEQELLGIVEAAADDEVIEHEERELIESILELGDTVTREVMVPRPDMITVDRSATVSAALDRAIKHGFSRLPVVDLDDVVGVAHVKDLITAERAERGGRLVTDLMRAARFVPENKPAADLMRELRTEAIHLAVVADEYGAVAGLVTLEDCLEELVGEIVDEYDIERPLIRALAGGDRLVDGRMSVNQLNEELTTDLPAEDWDTVGGLVFGVLGRIPVVGERLAVDGVELTVTKLDGHRVRTVRIGRL